MKETSLLEVRALRKDFWVRRGLLSRRRRVRAVDGVDLTIGAGETVGLVGESGCGKSTLARSMLRLVEPTAGSVLFRGEDLLALTSEELRTRRRYFQLVFQDASGSLNPRRRIGRSLAEPLRAHAIVPRDELRVEVRRLLELVGLPAALERRFPHQLSGGERQRVAIGRALATRPDLLIADEPVTALDRSVQRGVLELLGKLVDEAGLGMLLIAHDLHVVAEVAAEVNVMYFGRVVEKGPTIEVFRRPLHPYTVALLSAAPVVDSGSGRRRIVLEGEPPSPLLPPAGCAFHPRCPVATRMCRQEDPAVRTVTSERAVSCHHPGELELFPRSPLRTGTF